MARLLKERYDTKRLHEVRERAKAIDAQLMLEHRASALLAEAMSEDDLNKVSAIVKKLDSIRSPELPKLSAAIEQATADINKYTAGGPIAQAWSKMKEKVGFDNPIVKVTTFANALERGFSQIPQILKNNGVDMGNLKADLNRSLAQALTTGRGEMPKTVGAKVGQKTDDELSNTSYGGKSVFSDDPVGSQMPNPTQQDEADGSGDSNEKKLRSIVTQLTKALTPSGFFAAFKGVPYIKSADLAAELVAAPIRVFSNVARRIQTGPQAQQVGSDLQDKIQDKAQATSGSSVDGGGGEAGTAGSGSTPATGGADAAGQPGTVTGRAGSGTQKKPMNPKARGEALKRIIAASGVKDAEAAARFFNYLEDNGMINTEKFTASTPPPSTAS